MPKPSPDYPGILAAAKRIAAEQKSPLDKLEERWLGEDGTVLSPDVASLIKEVRDLRGRLDKIVALCDTSAYQVETTVELAQWVRMAARGEEQ